MSPDLPFVLAAPEHPSLDGAFGRFCAALGDELRRTGPSGASAPSLIRRLGPSATGLRLAAAHDGEILGLASIEATAPHGPELLVAVVERCRRQGVGGALGQALVARAGAMGVERIVVHTNRPNPALRALGAGVGFQVVDVGAGRLDLIRTLRPVTRSA
jgi:GNAT superfamily N-acetyltransferase